MVAEFGELLTAGSILLSGGAAFGGAVAALNGTRKRVAGIETTLADHVKADETHQRDVIDRLARIETKLDQL
jgi:hypothetical protein